MRTAWSWILTSMILLALAACSSSSENPPPDDESSGSGASWGVGGFGGMMTGSGGAGGFGGDNGQLGSLIVGVYFDDDPNNIYDDPTEIYNSIEITERIDGIVVATNTYGPEVKVPFVPVYEVPFLDLPDDTNLEVKISVNTNGCDSFSRIVQTRIVGGEKLLLRASISYHCQDGCEVGDIWWCKPEETCSAGHCVSPIVPPENLPDYDPAWPSYSGCKPPMSGVPTVDIGTGQSGFVPVANGDVVKLVAGGQGGYHVYVGLRMRHMLDKSVVTLQGYFPELGVKVGPVTSVHHFADEVGTGYCEDWGEEFRLDDAVPLPTLLGKVLQITAKVTDSEGATATAMKTIEISSSVGALQ